MAHEHDHDHDHDHDHGVGDEESEETRAELRRDLVRRHALAQIRQYPDVALRMKAKEVIAFDDDLADLAERMTELMADAQGVGLAATQVGLLQRLFVFEHDEDGPHAVVNPRIVDRSGETEVDSEGCLSLEGIRVPVERSVKVTLEGLDTKGEKLELVLEGMNARVVQHELDHLDGVLILDRTDDEHRKEALGLLRPQPALR
jgi:peptide deformylase